jgi:hypothetical protein
MGITITSEEFQVRRLKTSSYKGSISELHVWLTDSIAINQQDGREERAEAWPHHGEFLRPLQRPVVQ